MPLLSRWAIKLALLHFVAGILLGAAMLVAKAGFVDYGLLSHRLIHIHLLLFGWLLQLVYGVGHWILPKFSSGDRYGSTRLAVAAVVALNAGVGFACLQTSGHLLGAVGWGFEFASALLFAVHAWPRVKSFGR